MTVRPAAGVARCELVDIEPSATRWISAEASARVAKKAAELLGRGRAFRFVVRGDEILDVVDADPWAAGWQAYGVHLRWREWMPMILSAVALPLLLWLFRKGAPAAPP